MAWSTRWLPKSRRVPPPAAGGPSWRRSKRDSNRCVTRQGAAVGEGAHRAEVGVPPSVLVDREGEAEPLGELEGRAGVRRGEREGLVHDDRQAELERLPAERDVGVGRGRHRHGFGSGGNEPGEVVDHRGVGVLVGHQRPAFGGPGHDRDESHSVAEAINGAWK